MKRIFIISAAMVAALSGCTEQETGILGPVPGSDFEVTAAIAPVADKIASQWGGGASVSLMHREAGAKAYSFDGRFVRNEKGGFAGNLMEDLEPEAVYDWMAVYPYSETAENLSAVDLVISGEHQSQIGNGTTGHLYGDKLPAAGVLKSVKGKEKPVLEMHHLASFLELSVRNVLPENSLADKFTVNKISVKAGEEIVGNFTADLSGEAPVFTPVDGLSYDMTTLTVQEGKEISAGTAAGFYLALRPFTLSAEEKLEITVSATSSAGAGTHTAEITGKEIVFAPGNITTVEIGYSTVFSKTLDITGISPTSGSTGATIKIKGSGFEAYKDAVSVTFKDVEAEIVSVTDSEISVKVPEGLSGEGLAFGVDMAITLGTDTYKHDFMYTKSWYVETLFKGGKISSNPTGSIGFNDFGGFEEILHPGGNVVSALAIDGNDNLYLWGSRSGWNHDFYKADLKNKTLTQLFTYMSGGSERPVFCVSEDGTLYGTKPRSDWADFFIWNGSNNDDSKKYGLLPNMTGFSVEKHKTGMAVHPNGLVYMFADGELISVDYEDIIDYDVFGNGQTVEKRYRAHRYGRPEGLVADDCKAIYGICFDPRNTSVMYFTTENSGKLWKCDINSIIDNPEPSTDIKLTAERVTGNGNGQHKDGALNDAKFDRPRVICMDENGNIYLADMYNNSIRVIDTEKKMVSTLVGHRDRKGYQDGPGNEAKLSNTIGLVRDSSGSLYVLDTHAEGNNDADKYIAVRKISMQ